MKFLEFNISMPIVVVFNYKIILMQPNNINLKFIE